MWNDLVALKIQDYWIFYITGYVRLVDISDYWIYIDKWIYYDSQLAAATFNRVMNIKAGKSFGFIGLKTGCEHFDVCSFTHFANKLFPFRDGPKSPLFNVARFVNFAS